MRLLNSKSKPRTTRRNRLAMTLMEVMISAGIASLYVTGVIVLTNITLKQGLYAIGNYNDLNAKSRNMLDYLSRDIRGAVQMTAFATNSITMTNSLGTAFSYTWDGSNKVSRIYGSSTTILMTNCDYLSFNGYQRNPTNNFNFVSTTTLSQVKLVDVSWRCSRTYLGQKLNTESVQTARIVVRN